MTATAKVLPISPDSPVSVSLYAIGEEYQRIIDAITEAGGEITEAQMQELAAIEERFDVKAERVVLYMRNLLGLADAADNEAKRLSQLADGRRATAEGLKKYLFTQMTASQINEVERPLVKLKIVNNGGSLPVKWEGGNEAEIPAPYRTEKVVYGLDRAKVLEDHAAKVVLPAGIVVGERGKQLRIR